MAEAFLSLATPDRKAILETAASQSGRPAFILEKDVWICWILQTLFSIPGHHPMAFKGGTSLSKVYGVIDRFSEDVDITLDYRAFNEHFDPFMPGLSGQKIRKFSQHLTSLVEDYLRDVVVPALEAEATRLPTAGFHEVRAEGECVWFAYPSAVETSAGYLASEVLLEFGGRNTVEPNERHRIVPDLAEQFDSPDTTLPRK
ncbi:MAG: nucleotidyl transferase AbiEii/AbiGii toxin family protein [Candidatus Tectomicrobia bacterium]|nr:nucleotidyl transferase AbiEii/AbiGii toxin family protein [Candidatus Tectomicrobia bacterium]